MVHLTQQRHHFRMQHRGEQFCNKRWMPKALFQSVAPIISTFRMNFGQPNFLLCWQVKMESWKEDTIDVDFESHHEKNGGNRRKPLK